MFPLQLFIVHDNYPSGGIRGTALLNSTSDSFYKIPVYWLFYMYILFL